MEASAFLLVLGVGAVLGALAFAFVLATAAKRADEHGRRVNPLSLLCAVRSPSGKPFFPTSESVFDLAEALDGVSDQDSPQTHRVASERCRTRPRSVTWPSSAGGSSG